MSLVELTEFLVKSVVHEPDMVTVKQFDDEDLVNIEVLVSESDMGVVIGSRGKVVNSIRTIVQAVAHNQQIKKVVINIDSF